MARSDELGGARTRATVSVLALIDHLPVGGAQMLLGQFAAAAPAAGIELSVACLMSLDGNPAAIPLIAAGVEPVNLDVAGRGPRRMLCGVREHIAAVAPDIVHTHLGTSDWVGTMSARRLGVPAVCTLHAIAGPAPLKESVKRWIVRGCADRIIAVSDRAAVTYRGQHWARRGQMVTIKNGVTVAPLRGSGVEVRRGLGIPEDALVAGMISALRPEKGHLVAVDAVRLLRDRFPGLRLLIVGQGSAREAIEHRADDLGDVVVFAGQRSDVMRCFDACDVCLHPSHEDAFPTTLIEAMAASVPILATAVGGIPEIVTDGETGVLVPGPPSPAVLAEALAGLLDDPERRRSLAALGRARYEAEFTALPWVHETRALYDDVLARSRRRRRRSRPTPRAITRWRPRPARAVGGGPWRTGGAIRSDQWRLTSRSPRPPRGAVPAFAAAVPGGSGGSGGSGRSSGAGGSGLWWSLPGIPPWAIVAAAFAAAGGFGRFLTDGKPKYAVALVLGGLYAPIVFFDLPLAFAAFAAVQYFKDLHSLSVGPNTMGVLVGLSFIGAFIAHAPTLPVLRQQRPLLLATIVLMVWLTMSIAWSQDPGTAFTGAAYFWLGGLAMLIAMTALATVRDVKFVALAFVAGAIVAAAIGIATGSLNTAATETAAASSQTAVAGRLTGGGGDPNLQAAGFIAAMFLTMGLFNLYRRRAARVGLTLAFVLITLAFFATESRGGLLALVFATVVALLISPRHQRRRIMSLVMLVLVVAGVALAVQPGLLKRITNFGGGTSGRNDIWAVAVTVFEQHPLVGVGLNNFQVIEPRYALMHRNVSRVTYIAENPYPAHNTYLQMLDEAGVVGLAGLMLVVFLSLRAGVRAAHLFDQTGRPHHAQLARATVMGAVGMLTAIFFFTDGDDWRLWILLGLGPALLAVARGERSSGPVAV